MQVNPTTAPLGAPTTPSRQEKERELLALYDAASPFKKYVMYVLISAASDKNTAPLHALIRACPRNETVKAAARKLIDYIEWEVQA